MVYTLKKQLRNFDVLYLMRNIMLAILLYSNALHAQVSDTSQHEQRPKVYVFKGVDISIASLKGQNELEIGTGLVSGREIVYDLGASRGPMVTSATPTLFVSYHYYFFDRLALGLTYGLQSINGNSNYENNPVPPYNFRDRCQTLAVEGKFAFLVRKTIVLYQFIGIGTSVITERKDYGNYSNTATGYTLNTQFTPFGLRYGRTFAFFTEIGIGYKGLVNMGLSYEPGYRKHKKSKGKTITVSI